MSLTRLLFACGCLVLVDVAHAAEKTEAPAVEVDLSALRYYASRNETARVDAEIRRLRSLYPGWQPPADPASLPQETEAPSDDEPLWALFAADKLDELRKAISDHRAADPSWPVPPELEQKLALKEARRDLIDASDRQAFDTVVAIADKTPGLVTPGDLDIAWRTAEAQSRIGRDDKALELDQAILGATQDGAARLATVQKAMASLKPEDVEKLLDLGKKGPDGRSEFDSIELDLLRRRVGRVLDGGVPDTITPTEIDRLAIAAKAQAGADDASLLGWLFAERKDYAKAKDWFDVALAAVPEPLKAGPSAVRRKDRRLPSRSSAGWRKPRTSPSAGATAIRR
jgi:cellulose synthase operon protein C